MFELGLTEPKFNGYRQWNKLIKKIFILFMVFFMSIVSYYLIEKPFRENNFRFRNILKIIQLLYLTVGVTKFIMLPIIKMIGKELIKMERNYPKVHIIM